MLNPYNNINIRLHGLDNEPLILDVDFNYNLIPMLEWELRVFGDGFRDIHHIPPTSNLIYFSLTLDGHIYHLNNNLFIPFYKPMVYTFNLSINEKFIKILKPLVYTSGIDE